MDGAVDSTSNYENEKTWSHCRKTQEVMSPSSETLPEYWILRRRRCSWFSIHWWRWMAQLIRHPIVKMEKRTGHAHSPHLVSECSHHLSEMGHDLREMIWVSENWTNERPQDWWRSGCDIQLRKWKDVISLSENSRSNVIVFGNFTWVLNIEKEKVQLILHPLVKMDGAVDAPSHSENGKADGTRALAAFGFWKFSPLVWDGSWFKRNDLSVGKLD